MVSTRGIKLKFFEGERVLCYEPDPTKAKVLYDSKVLDIIINKDHRGRKTVEYLIHFQGWNSSWDRCVGEEFVLKDTPENRQLQKDLAEKAQLQLGAYLYRRERKKHNRKLCEPVAQSSEDGSSVGSPTLMDTDDGHDHDQSSSSEEEDSSADEELIQIELTNDLKDWLEHDYNLINNKSRLMRLPAEPNVVNILESFWKQYVTNQMCGLNEKPNTRYRQPCTASNVKTKPDDVQRNLNLCKEALDGLRIYFDFTLNDLLLYESEKTQTETKFAVYASPPAAIKCEPSIKTDDETDYTGLTSSETDQENCNNHQGGGETFPGKPVTRRRGLRSQRVVDSNSNGSQASEAAAPKAPPNSAPELPAPVLKELSWHLLPQYVGNQHPTPPSLVYGATHFTRLMVKLPELLCTTSMDEGKLKALLPYFDSIVYFLTEHKEWFGEKHYADS